VGGALAFAGEAATIGWDVGVTTDGIMLIEGNHHWDPHLPQITLRRGIKSEMLGLLRQIERTEPWRRTDRTEPQFS
jgi:hypothetical protein